MGWERMGEDGIWDGDQCDVIGEDGMGEDGMGWDRMEWDGIGWYGME